MKKKGKLLASLLSFCFTIGVLCFGVYAAQTVSYTIGGTLTYELDDVFVQVSRAVYKDDAKQTAAELKTTVDDIEDSSTAYSAPGDSAVTGKDMAIVLKSYDDGSLVDPATPPGSNTPEAEAINLAFSTGDNAVLTYYIVFKVDNYSATPAYVTITANIDANSNVVTNARTSTTATIPAKTGNNAITRYYAIGISLDNLTTSIAENKSYTFAVSVSNQEPDSVSNRLQYSENGEYWYLTMGYKAGASGTGTEDLRWRLVAQNSSGTYTAVNPASSATLSGTYVFVQETAVVTSRAWNSSGVTKYNLSDIYTYLANTSTGGYLEALGITTSNVVYSQISARTAADDTGNSASYTDEFSSQKLWLLSREEVFEESWFGYDRVADNSSVNVYNNSSSEPVSWWLRSPYDSTYVKVVLSYGDGNSFSLDHTLAVRAAFQITI